MYICVYLRYTTTVSMYVGRVAFSVVKSNKYVRMKMLNEKERYSVSSWNKSL